MKQCIQATFFKMEDMEDAFKNFSSNSEIESFQNGKVAIRGKRGDTDMTVTMEYHFKMTIEWKDNIDGLDKESIKKTITNSNGLINDIFVTQLN